MQYLETNDNSVNNEVPILHAIEPSGKHGVYFARVHIKNVEYIFQITIDDNGTIPVASGETQLFAALNEDIDSYTNILKAVLQKYQNQELSLPASLHLL